jgi:hypothetical protein
MEVDRRLGLEGGSKSARAADLGDPTFHPDSGIEAIAFATTEGADLGHTLGLTIVAGYSTEELPVAAYADSLPFNAADEHGSGLATTCRIRVLTTVTPNPASPNGRKIFLGQQEKPR